MTQIEPVAASHSAGVPVLGYQYWVDGFDLRAALRMRHTDPFVKPDQQLRHGGTLSEHNAFPSTPEIPFYYMSQLRHGTSLSDHHTFPATAEIPFYYMSQTRNPPDIVDDKFEFDHGKRPNSMTIQSD